HLQNHILSRLVRPRARTGPEIAVNLAAEYAKVHMAKGREVISRSLIDTALTIHGRVLWIPATERLLLDIDNLPRTENPFNSVQRLQAIVSECGSNKEHSTWVLEHICHMVCAPVVDKVDSSEFTVDALRGSSKTGSRGLVDVIRLNKEALGNLCHKLPIQLGFHGDSDWLSEVRPHLKDHAAHKASTQVEALSRRNFLDPGQGRYVAFVEELLYGKRYDPNLDAPRRAGNDITAIDTFPGLMGPIDDVKTPLASEQKE
ncbi:MAG: hypothetical protein ACKPKO_47215, partial [Candidatus Fonsibacter sp.]